MTTEQLALEESGAWSESGPTLFQLSYTKLLEAGAETRSGEWGGGGGCGGGAGVGGGLYLYKATVSPQEFCYA